MNYHFLIAALLTYAIALAHSILGEWLIIIPLSRTELPQLLGRENAMERVLRFAWHLTTVVLFGLATLVAFWSTTAVDAAIAAMSEAAAATFAASAVLSLVLTRARHFSWYVFAAIAILLWLGGR
jgi:hypothetical protein